MEAYTRVVSELLMRSSWILVYFMLCNSHSALLVFCHPQGWFYPCLQIRNLEALRGYEPYTRLLSKVESWLSPCLLILSPVLFSNVLPEIHSLFKKMSNSKIYKIEEIKLKACTSLWYYISYLLLDNRWPQT